MSSKDCTLLLKSVYVICEANAVACTENKQKAMNGNEAFVLIESRTKYQIVLTKKVNINTVHQC